MAQDWPPNKGHTGAAKSVMNVVPVALGQAGQQHGGAVQGSPGKPLVEGGYKDAGWGFVFVLHALGIIGLAIALGKPSLEDDSKEPVDDPDRGTLDFNSALFIRVIALACGVGAGMSTLMLWALQRWAGAFISCALYTSLAIQVVLTAAMFMVNPIFGVFMLIVLFFTGLYVYYVRARIPFAAAHMDTAIQAVKTHPGVFFFALASLALQVAWVLVWSLASFGLEHKINNPNGVVVTPTGSGSGSGSGTGTQGTSTGNGTTGGAVSFVMLLSLLWGVQLLKYIVQFVTADVVGSWWFEAVPKSGVGSAIKRAFGRSFGSLAFGAFIVALIETIKRMAEAARRNAQKSGRDGAALIACMAVCILGCIESLVDYLNAWAIPIIALTGVHYTKAGKEAMNLFRHRGWDAIINDDLVGDALRIASLMVAAGSGLAGAAIVYVGMPHATQRSSIAGIAAIFCFIVGYALSALMMGVVISAVRTVFVAFAMDPAALGGSHPDYLAKLNSAWQTAHPQVFAQCGYAAAMDSGAYIAPHTAFAPGPGGPGAGGGGYGPSGGAPVPMPMPMPAHGAAYGQPVPMGYPVQQHGQGQGYGAASAPMAYPGYPPQHQHQQAHYGGGGPPMAIPVQQGGGGYPPQAGYPTQQYPPQQYPPQAQGYPPQAQGGYQGYPPAGYTGAPVYGNAPHIA